MPRVYLAAILGLALAALAAPAQASTLTLVNTDGSPATDLQRIVDASPAPLAAGTMIIHRAGCFDGSGRACTTFPGDEMWMPPLEWEHVREDLPHELGHRFDYLVMTDTARDRFRALIGDARPWRTSPNSPHEQFASAYGVCMQHRTIHGRIDRGYGYWAGPVRHRRVCRLIRQAAVGMFG